MARRDSCAPLPEGMEWEKVRDPNIGEFFWVVVELQQ